MGPLLCCAKRARQAGIEALRKASTAALHQAIIQGMESAQCIEKGCGNAHRQ